MKTKNFIILSVLSLILSACFSPWQGDVGTFSISFGGGNRAARNVFEDDGNNDGEQGNDEEPKPIDIFYLLLENRIISHTIKISDGPGPDQIKENVYYEQKANFSVTPGRWDISVEAWLDLQTLIDIINNGNEEGEEGGEDFDESNIPEGLLQDGKILVAKGIRKGVDIKSGQNGLITISMKLSEGLIPDDEDNNNSSDYSVEITFERITDINPINENIVISRSDPAKKTFTLKLENPKQYDYIEWSINGVIKYIYKDDEITEEEFSFTLDADNNLYNSEGEHALSLVVRKDGIPYNQTIFFSVEK